MNAVRCSLLALLIMIASPLMAQAPLFSSRAYTVHSDRVVQGDASARAVSAGELVSSYRSPYRTKTKRIIEIKFSINGYDNERSVGQNHRLLLPQAGKAVSPLYVYGGPDDMTASLEGKPNDAVLTGDVDLLVRVDMRGVLRQFKEKGYAEMHNGQRFPADQPWNVYLAGNTEPLTWNFASLPGRSDRRLTDPDGDGIYTLTIRIPREFRAEGEAAAERTWKLSRDIAAFPALRSPFVLTNALYNMALEEMLQDVREDGAFMAGEMWPGVWTRDISYSIILSLALVHPDACKASLMAKVKDGHIIQDTGTGGSWPVSTDRLVWALAAWEVYTTTGDREWLRQSYGIIRASMEEDMHAAYDAETGLFFGESSFLDWREQTYPRWMDPKDIYASRTLGTNAVHYRALTILTAMAEILGEPAGEYRSIAEGVRKGINSHLWVKGQQYYGQYLYGRVHPSLSPRSEALGEALTILCGIADAGRARMVLASTPVTDYGIPCIYPQIPNLPPYHNDAVWPFVEAYWGWASAAAGNEASAEQALASVTRAAALFLTNKENFISSTGDYMGTEINSSRQLWSVAGNLAMTIRILFGMRFDADRLSFAPMVPRAWEGEWSLTNVRYRNAVLDITVKGSGSAIASALLDSTVLPKAEIPGDLKGRHSVVITLARQSAGGSIAMMPHATAPETPVVTRTKETIRWRPIPGAERYRIVRNGVTVSETKKTAAPIGPVKEFSEYQVLAINAAGHESFLSEPLAVLPSDAVKQFQVETGRTDVVRQYAGFTGNGAIRLSQGLNESLTVPVSVQQDGRYLVDIRYANGNGPINTDNKCCIRTLLVDGRPGKSVIVLPQRGEQVWTQWGYSNGVIIELPAGQHTLALVFTRLDANMNGAVNTALVDCVRLTRLPGAGGGK